MSMYAAAEPVAVDGQVLPLLVTCSSSTSSYTRFNGPPGEGKETSEAGFLQGYKNTIIVTISYGCG